MAALTKVNAFLHGGDYNPDQWQKYPDILSADVDLLKKAHINTVSMGIFAWMALEPEEGHFAFDWLDERIETMYRNGIYTVLATPSGARPAWLDRKYPEAMRVDSYGVRRHHGLRHNHCMSSPVDREKVRIINTKLAERYKDHPGVILWHLSNEYGGECYCDLCAEKFRSWLRDKYGTVEALNDAYWTSFWAHTYTSFDEVEPPYQNGEQSVAALKLDWQQFTTWNTADFMKAEIDALKAVTPDIPVTTNFYLTEQLDYAKLAEPLDLVCWDSYPRWGEAGSTPAHTAAVTAFTHSRMRNYKPGKPFLLMESTPSLVNHHPINKLKRPGMHRLSSLQAVACGSDSVQYFQIRKSRGSFEQFHGAVIDHDGSDRTRVNKDVQALGEDLLKLTPVLGSTLRPKAATT